MASSPPIGYSVTPPLRTVEIMVRLDPSGPPERMHVPAATEAEAYRLLGSIADGVPAAVVWGSVLEPIRSGYKRQLEQVELEIRRRRALLGKNPTEYELRGLAQWAARQRTNTARLWRIPLPVTGAGLELRDWRKYGAGGRTFDNLLDRNARQGRTGMAAYENMLGSATRSNPEYNAKIARGAKLLKGGGGVLAVAGLAVTAHDIWQAPADQRGKVLTRHGVGFAGGLIGAEVAGGLLTIGAGLLLATPPGWLVLAVGLVGGIAGGVIVDRLVYPEDHVPTATDLGNGMAVDPLRLPTKASSSRTGTTLPVVEQIRIVVRRDDTPETIIQRASMQAAASVGLDAERQRAFADRSGSNLIWRSGDPSPGTDRTMRGGDIAATAGQSVIFRLSDSQRSELAALAGQ
ncbi:hypothetical protein GCM10022268_36320 [Sphingomonas cynarae]|uniref:Uncharacterized protein n=1 Tax=Sphingomonas cynarae TaxID=930197 RepID=A0ABP7EUT3_9SPHN